MAALFDATDPAYLDEKATRDELTRVFDVCGGCRRCVDLCASFDTLFDLLDDATVGGTAGGAVGGAAGDVSGHDAGRLSPAQQDAVVDRCFHCDLCLDRCPYAPTRHEAAVDVPVALLRAGAMKRATGQRSARERWVATVLGRPDRLARMASVAPATVHRFVTAAPGSMRRRLLTALTGVTGRRRLPALARRRFSSRVGAVGPDETLVSEPTAGPIVLYPTCLVEYGATELGDRLVAEYRAAGLACTVSSAGCCGAPRLHAGDVRSFASTATSVVTALAGQIRRGATVVVAQPSCAAVLRRHAERHVAVPARGDAALVAERIVDASTPLAAAGAAADATSAPHRTTVSLHVPVAGTGADDTDLLRATGAAVSPVAIGAGVTSTWGLRAAHDDVVARQVTRAARALGDPGDHGATPPHPTAGAGTPGGSRRDHVATADLFAALTVGERLAGTPRHPVHLARSDRLGGRDDPPVGGLPGR